MLVEEVLNSLKFDLRFQDNIKAVHQISSRDPEFCQFPENLNPAIEFALKQIGIKHLYSHQKRAWDEIEIGNNIVVVTGTASGKSLCYNLPVLNDLLNCGKSTALYLFPTKALSQDQYKSISQLTHLMKTFKPGNFVKAQHEMMSIPVGIYDGDTPNEHRAHIRADSRILFSNPDMLHMGILPHHTAWSRFLSDLRFIVIDEIHTYRGIFGSHLANVVRRLKRILRFYKSSPSFIMTSATIANPVELAERLVEENFVLIDQDGSSRGAQSFVIYSPPIINSELGLRKSALVECADLLDDLFHIDFQSIIFCRSRPAVEILLSILRQRFSNIPDQIINRIRGYRSGYLPSQRREIEAGLKKGDVKIVVATNALELGIDIGGVDSVFMIGYPGTISATRQQAGRAGRGQSPSLAIMIVTSDPIDQFLATHPEYLFSGSPESALINPDNLLILLNHLRCSLYEIPFNEGEGFGNVKSSKISELLDILTIQGQAYHSGTKFFYTSDVYPSQAISLRNNSPEQIILKYVDEEASNPTPQVIGKVDYLSAHWLVHPGAIYLHEAQPYFVQELDFQQRHAILAPRSFDYYTVPLRDLKINIVEISKQLDEQAIIRGYGELLVTSQVTGYKKNRWYTNEQLEVNKLDLPPTDLQTTGYWIGLREFTVDQLRESNLWNNDPINYGPDWISQKEKARARDRFHCQNCGSSEINRAHDVHHKIPFRLFSDFKQANRLENLVTLCHDCHLQVEQNVRLRSGLSGLAYLLAHLAPFFLMCDTRDIGVHSDAQSNFLTGLPAVVIYEEALGGLGFSEHLFDIHDHLIEQAYQLVMSCECKDGCPSCVGPGGENGAGSKRQTMAILDVLRTHAITY